MNTLNYFDHFDDMQQQQQTMCVRAHSPVPHGIHNILAQKLNVNELYACHKSHFLKCVDAWSFITGFLKPKMSLDAIEYQSSSGLILSTGL